MKRRIATVSILVAAIVGVSLGVVVSQPEWALAGDSPARLALELASGLALAVAGIVVIVRGPDATSGMLLVTAGAMWLMREWNNPGAPDAFVFTLGIVVATATPPVVANAVLTHGRGQLESGVARIVVGAGYAGLIAIAGVASAFAHDPRASGCNTCPANILSATESVRAQELLERWGLWLGCAALAGAILLAAARLWRATPAARRTIAPVVMPGAIFLALAVGESVGDLLRGWTPADAIGGALLVPQSAALLAIALGVAWQRIAARRMRARLARLVVEMADAAGPSGLRDLLANAVGDPTLEIVYPLETGWVDAGGNTRQLSVDDGRGVTSLIQDGEVAAVVIHRHGLFDDPALVEELGRAARLAIDHERLQAQQRAQLDRLRAARSAIVAAADAERRRLERDLHDGAQQSLAGLAMAIGLARGSVTDDDALVAAQGHVRTALDRVRSLAHATYPAALDEGGLAAALDVLSEWRPHVELATVPDGRVERPVEAGVYFIVAALTRPAAPDTLVHVSVTRDNGQMIVEVHPGPDSDLTDVEDRVGALGGRLTRADADGGESVIRVEVACAS